MIDLRSDTVTKPTPAMRRAMAEAEVGDDVYGEDPTVNRLERRAAEMMGKEAALFVPTGCMGNVIGIKLHTRPGDEVICDDHSHIVDWEHGTHSWFSGVVLRTVPADGGILRWCDIERAIRPTSPHCSPTTVVHLENTHNMGGGAVYPPAELDRICDSAHDRGLKVHLDGARIFNAAVASGVPASRIAAKADTVMFCLSKGLGAPVGSILIGSSEAIARARTHRKQLGGGTRQAGVLAAPGLIALEEMPARLGEDHANARLLADGLASIPCVKLDPAKVVTNIVIFDTAEASIRPSELVTKAKSNGVLLSVISGTLIRLVTHFDVSRDDCLKAVEVLTRLLTTASSS